MAATRILFGFICFAAFGWCRLPGRDLLVVDSTYVKAFDRAIDSFKRRKEPKRLISIAEAELWVREESGQNDGPRVEEYLAYVSLKKGDPWCAAFVSFVFMKAGYREPRTGWSPALFPVRKLVQAAAPGNVFGVYFPALKRIAHCGLVCNVRGDWISTIEGNSNLNGSREGTGVFRRLRHKRTISRYANWL